MNTFAGNDMGNYFYRRRIALYLISLFGLFGIHVDADHLIAPIVAGLWPNLSNISGRPLHFSVFFGCWTLVFYTGTLTTRLLLATLKYN